MRGRDSRRTFIGRVGRISAGIACTGMVPLAGGCAALPRVSPVVTDGTARVPLNAFGEGSGVLVDLPTEALPLYVHRHEGDRFTAVLTRCSHRGCEVEPVADRMVCPCHGSEYELDGRLLEGPATSPLTRYRVEADGTHVRIDLRSTGDIS